MANTRKRTGLVFDARAVDGWDTGTAGGVFPANPDPKQLILPAHHYENAATKRNIKNLLDATGLTDQCVTIPARRATRKELLRVHSAAHIDKVNEISARERGGYGDDQQTTLIGHNGHELAELAFGGAIELAMAVWHHQEVTNGYMLMRPPGHHATRDGAMGFCVYNNLAGAAHALLAEGAQRILIVDWDVHTGNGTQDIFGNNRGHDQQVVDVDMHQAESFPPGAGHTDVRGPHKNILNLDLPPGYGHETALYAFQKVVLPAIKRFNPQIILVASGFDSGLTDPLGRALLGPATFGEMTRLLLQAANNPTCKGRVVMFHEGGYDSLATGDHGVAVFEQLTGFNTGRASTFDQVSTWQNKGNRERTLALHREMVDEVAAFVNDLPTH